MFLNGHGRHFYYFLGRAPIDCDPDRMYPTIDCRSGHMVIHELGFWIYGVNTHELNKLGLWFFRARVRVHRFHAAQSWFNERAKHIFASATSRLATTIPRLAAAILCLTPCIPNSKQRFKERSKASNVRIQRKNIRVFTPHRKRGKLKIRSTNIRSHGLPVETGATQKKNAEKKRNQGAYRQNQMSQRDKDTRAAENISGEKYCGHVPFIFGVRRRMTVNKNVA